jgi:hypothetical protein
MTPILKRTQARSKRRFGTETGIWAGSIPGKGEIPCESKMGSQGKGRPILRAFP